MAQTKQACALGQCEVEISSAVNPTRAVHAKRLVAFTLLSRFMNCPGEERAVEAEGATPRNSQAASLTNDKTSGERYLTFVSSEEDNALDRGILPARHAKTHSFQDRWRA